MAEDAPAPGAVRPEGTPRSVRKGDVPETLERRYFTDARGGRGLGFYADARITRPAFRDEGRRLIAARNDPNVARDLAAIARHRGWSMVVVQGDPAFRREIWLAGRAAGLEVRGYRPTERDVQELTRRSQEVERRARGERRAGRSLGGTSPSAAAETRAQEAPRARTTLRMVDTIVRARVKSPQAQERILTAARERLASWLERGDRGSQMPNATVPDRDASGAPRKERSRGR